MAEFSLADITQVKSKAIVRRRSLAHLVEKELIQRENKRIHIIDKFVVSKNDITDAPIQEKFYSKYYAYPPSFNRHLDSVNNDECLGKRRTLFPVLESQVYGWIPENISSSEICQLNAIRAPKLRCDMTIHDEKFISQKHTERPKFKGLRFFV